MFKPYMFLYVRYLENILHFYIFIPWDFKLLFLRKRTFYKFRRIRKIVFFSLIDFLRLKKLLIIY